MVQAFSSTLLMRGAVACMLLASVLANRCPALNQGPGPIRVMSFNIRYDNQGDGDNAWDHRKDHVASMLRFHAVDIAGLQEALARQIDDLEQRLPDFAWVGVGRDDGKQRGEYAPIFYRKSRFEVLDTGSFWLSTEPDVAGKLGWDAVCPRIVTWAKLRDRRAAHRGSTGAGNRTRDDGPTGAGNGAPAGDAAGAGSVLYVYNTHFDHRGARAREESARLLLGRIMQRSGGSPIVVTGDFNCTESSKPYAILTVPLVGQLAPVLADARVRSRTPHHGPTTTWNGFRPTYEPGRKIDHVFVSATIDVLRHGVLSDTFDGRFPSDHLPVLAEVRLAAP